MLYLHLIDITNYTPRAMSWTTGNISAVTHRSELCFHWIFTGTDMDYATQVIRDAKHPLGQSVCWYISIRRQGCATFPSGIEPFQLVRSFNLHSLMLLFAFQMPGAPTRPLPPLSADRPRITPSPRLNPPCLPPHTYIHSDWPIHQLSNKHWIQGLWGKWKIIDWEIGK